MDGNNSHNYSNNEDAASLKRRFRTNFTEEQAEFLEESFQDSHYPDQAAKKEMAKTLDIPEDRITVWFQNRRAKWRRKEMRDKEKSRPEPQPNYNYCYEPAYYDNQYPPGGLQYVPCDQTQMIAPENSNCHQFSHHEIQN